MNRQLVHWGVSAILPLLGGCATVEPSPQLGVVGEIYIEAAPGLYVERRLAGNHQRSTWASVTINNRDGQPADFALARTATDVAEGDLVSVTPAGIAARNAQLRPFSRVELAPIPVQTAQQLPDAVSVDLAASR